MVTSQYYRNIFGFVQFEVHKKISKFYFRYENVQKGPELFTTNGLNSLKYHVKEIKHRVAFTSILVDLVPEEVSLSAF